MQKPLYLELDENDTTGDRECKVVILHGFSPAQLRAVVDAYRANDSLPQDVAFGIMTTDSAKRKLGDVVEDLKGDAKEAAKRMKSRKSNRR